MSIPLSVYTGVEATRVERKEFIQAGDALVSVGRSPIRKDNGEVVDNADVVRMAQADNGAWVELTDDEIAACTSHRGLAEVVTFVRNSKVGEYLVEDVKQVRPKKDKGKANPAADKAFVLLLSVMEKAKLHALVNVAMRGPARYALLDCKGNLFLVHSADQIRNRIDLPEATVSEQELALADALVGAIGISAPTLVDCTAPLVRTYVNAKAGGAPVVEAVEAPVIGADIMAQLSASIDAAKAAKGSVA